MDVLWEGLRILSVIASGLFDLAVENRVRKLSSSQIVLELENQQRPKNFFRAKCHYCHCADIVFMHFVVFREDVNPPRDHGYSKTTMRKKEETASDAILSRRGYSAPRLSSLH